MIPVPQRCRSLLQQCVAINGGGQRVQFFDDRVQINAVRITERNYVPDEGLGGYWTLRQMALSADGNSMATVESKDSAIMNKNGLKGTWYMLKFWTWEQDAFVNETFTYDAHTDNFYVVAHPTASDMFFTASEDGTFKTWQLEDEKWRCVAVSGWR